MEWSPCHRIRPACLDPDCTTPTWPCMLGLGPQEPAPLLPSPLCGNWGPRLCAASSQPHMQGSGSWDPVLPLLISMCQDWSPGALCHLAQRAVFRSPGSCAASTWPCKQGLSSGTLSQLLPVPLPCSGPWVPMSAPPQIGLYGQCHLHCTLGLGHVLPCTWDLVHRATNP